MDIFSNQMFDMTCIPGNVLLSHFVVWAGDPVLGKPATVTENLFVFRHLVIEACGIQSRFFIFEFAESIHETFVLTCILQDLTFDLTSCATKSNTLGWNMASVPWHIVDFEITRSCCLRHF